MNILLTFLLSMQSPFMNVHVYVRIMKDHEDHRSTVMNRKLGVTHLNCQTRTLLIITKNKEVI